MKIEKPRILIFIVAYKAESHIESVLDRIPSDIWERGINENTNGLIRQYFPKGTDFNKVTDSQIEFVMKRLNTRPRKTRGGKQPVELFLGKAVDLLTA
jgi:IS30 family transposase